MFRGQGSFTPKSRTAAKESSPAGSNGGATTAVFSQRSARGWLPEVSLVAAVFEDAVRCAQGAGRGVTHRQSEEAHDWIGSERRDWPFAFVNLCDILGVDAERVRMQVRAGSDMTLR